MAIARSSSRHARCTAATSWKTSNVGDSASFDEWALLTREQLRLEACGLLRRLTDPRAGVGDLAGVCDYARRWVALDPLDEAAHRRLISVLAESGQRTAALAQFERCRRLLDAELGIEPEPATVALYEELKQHIPPAAPSASRSHAEQLPQTPLTRLIGRESELRSLAVQLADPATRLLTIVGPGGVGKTRLALAAARAGAAALADGVCCVQLAPLRDPIRVLATLAQALGVPKNDARPLDELVRAALAPRRMLLLLDNCEHLLPALATLVAELLAAAPDVTILATSRVALRLSQERRFQLAPLSLPDANRPLDAQPGSAAVELFIERAHAVRPSHDPDLDSIGAICHRLDGLPLAIELAATRTRLLSPRELLARLEQRLPLLSGGPRDLPERHQTLYATIDWSYRLLDPGQQALLRRLAVFADGWTVAAAEAVCAGLLDTGASSVHVLDGLAALLDGSLIVEATNAAGEPRCTMLETIREYAYAELVANGELAGAQELHAGYYVDLAAKSAAKLAGPDQLQWFERIHTERENMRLALGWCVEHAAGAGLRLASDLNTFWTMRGCRREGLSWLESLLERAVRPGVVPPSTREYAYGLLVAGMLSRILDDVELSAVRLRKSLALYRRLEDQFSIAWVLNNLGNLALQQGAYAEAEGYYRESLALRRELGHVVGIASSLNNLAEVTRLQGDLEAAKSYFDQSLILYRQAGDTVAVASVMGNTATILLQQGEYLQAQQLYAASYAIAQELDIKPDLRQTLLGLGNVARVQRRYDEAKHYYCRSLAVLAEMHTVSDVTLSLSKLAAVAVAEQHLERAAVLLSAVEALDRGAQITHDPDDTAEVELSLAALRAELDGATFDAAWSRGQVLSLEQAVDLACDDAM